MGVGQQLAGGRAGTPAAARCADWNCYRDGGSAQRVSCQGGGRLQRRRLCAHACMQSRTAAVAVRASPRRAALRSTTPPECITRTPRHSRVGLSLQRRAALRLLQLALGEGRRCTHACSFRGVCWLDVGCAREPSRGDVDPYRRLPVGASPRHVQCDHRRDFNSCGPADSPAV